MMKKISLALLCSALTLSQTQAADWQLVDPSSGNEFKLFFDKHSVSTVTTYAGKMYQQAWFKNEILRDINLDDNLAVGDYMLNLWRFDCQSRKLVLNKSVRYQQNGTYIEEINLPITVMRSVIPQTAGELMWNRVCLGL